MDPNKNQEQSSIDSSSANSSKSVLTKDADSSITNILADNNNFKTHKRNKSIGSILVNEQANPDEGNAQLLTSKSRKKYKQETHTKNKNTDLNVLKGPSSIDSTSTDISESKKSSKRTKNIKSNVLISEHTLRDKEKHKAHVRHKSISSTSEVEQLQGHNSNYEESRKYSIRRSLDNHQTPEFGHPKHNELKTRRSYRNENLYSPDSSNSSKSIDQVEGNCSNFQYHENSNDSAQKSQHSHQKSNISNSKKNDHSYNKDKHLRHLPCSNNIVEKTHSASREAATYQRKHEVYDQSSRMCETFGPTRSNSGSFSRSKSRVSDMDYYHSQIRENSHPASREAAPNQRPDGSPKMCEPSGLTRNNLRSHSRSQSRDRVEDYYHSQENTYSDSRDSVPYNRSHEVCNHSQRMCEPSGPTRTEMRPLFRSKSRDRLEDYHHSQGNIYSDSKESVSHQRSYEVYNRSPKTYETSGLTRSNTRTYSRSKSRDRVEDYYHSQENTFSNHKELESHQRLYEVYDRSPKKYEISGLTRNNTRTHSRSKSRDRVEDFHNSQIIEEQKIFHERGRQRKHFESSDYENDHKNHYGHRSKSTSRLQNVSNKNSSVSYQTSDMTVPKTQRKNTYAVNRSALDYEKFSAVNDSCISTPKEDMHVKHSSHSKTSPYQAHTQFQSVSKDTKEDSENRTFDVANINNSQEGKCKKDCSPSYGDMSVKNTSSCSEKGKGMGRGKLMKFLSDQNKHSSALSSTVRSKSPSTSESLEYICNDMPEKILLKENEKSVKKQTTSTISISSENQECQNVSEHTVIHSDKITEEHVKDSQEDQPSNKKDLINNEHEDRYFNIEPPKFLKYPLDGATLLTNVDNVKGVMTNLPPADVYEQLLSDTSEHEPLDSCALPSNTIRLEKEIMSEYSIGQLTERMKLTCGIIHGNIRTNPVSTVSELNLNTHIIANMNYKKINDLTRSQMYATPVLLQRRNLVLIGPPNTGKTFGCVIAIMSLLEDTDYYNGLKQGNGPLCVFVTSRSTNANHIAQFCSAVSGAKRSIITTYGGGLERTVDLANGCDILATTPRCWLRLLKNSTVTNLSRLCHLIFDDVDLLLDKFLPEVQEIMSQARKMLHFRKTECSIGLHIALVGERWSPLLDESLKVIDSPVLCITSHLESAMYAKLKPTTYILQPDAKIQKLKDLLKRNSPRKRTVIVCKSAHEVKVLRSILELSMPSVLIAHDEMSISLICDTSSKWVNIATPPILVCSDSILGELGITNAQHLIHYSLPENKSYFSERFGTIIEHLHDRVKHPKSAPPDCQVDILVDDTNDQQFPEIVSLMKRMSTPIPNEIQTAVKNIYNERERKKLDMPLCHYILMFGKCFIKEKCNYRHIFNNKTDIGKIIPQSGMLKLKCLHVHNPSRYSVRILATKQDANDQWDKVKSNYVLLGFKMSSYFSQRENRIPHGRVNVGDIVAIEVEPDVLFKRAVVSDIILRDEKLNPTSVKVQLIDDGDILETKAIQLLYLPPELQNFEPESCDLYLTGLQPVDFDPTWSFATSKKLKRNLDALPDKENEHFFVAKILLTVGANIIASSFVCYEWLELSKVYRVVFSPKKFVLDSDLAVPNEEHVPSILNLALEGGLISSYPTGLKDEEEQSKATEQVQWAYLEQNKFIPCFVISCEHPSLFYLKLDHFSESLSLLQKELTDSLDKKIIKPEMLREDMACAVRNPLDNEWNRAIILDVLSSEEVEVFCVDYGDVIKVPLSDLSLLPEGFISKLPFQAIECSLAGIVSLDKEWSDDAFTFFYSMTGNEDYVLKLLYTKVCEVKEEAKTTDGRHYKVILIDASNDTAICLNREMVYKGYANWNPLTKSCLSDIASVADIIKGNDKYEEEVEENEDNEVWTEEMSIETPDVSTKSEGMSGESINFGEKSKKDISNSSNILEVIKNGDFDFVFDDSGFQLLQNQVLGKDKGGASNLPALPPPPPPCNESQAEEFHQESLISENISSKSTSGRESRSELYSLSKVSFSELLENSDNESTSTDNDYINLTKAFDNIFHPSVLWSQTSCNIKLKIMVPDINQYQIDHSEFRLRFLACVDKKYYWFDLHLFGPICAESTVYSPKGQYFEIKLEKFIKGVQWPRPTYKDIKYSWLKVDPESIVKRKNLSISDLLIDRGSEISRYKKAYKLCLSRGASPYGVCGPDDDSDSESAISNSSDKEFYDLRSPFDADND